jgi:tetratricopeptide (TPR) repeat protein
MSLRCASQPPRSLRSVEIAMPTLARSLPVLVTASALAALAGGISGCSLRGQHTAEGASMAQQRMSGLKSGMQFQMAEQQFAAGDLQKAERSADAALAALPKFAPAHVLKGRVQLEKGQLEGAMASFQEAETLDPNNVDAQYFLGIVHERFSQPEPALARYRKAMELDADNPQYLVAAAEMLVSLGRLDEARELAVSKREQFSHSAAVAQTLAAIATLQGDTEAAVAAYGDARLLAPDDNTILEGLARAQTAAGKYADAEFNLAMLLDPKRAKQPAASADATKRSDRSSPAPVGPQARRDLQLLRARCLMEIDRAGEARRVLQDMASEPEGGRDVQMWALLGKAALKLDDLTTVRQASGRLVAIAPDRHEGYMLRGMVLRRSGDLSGALTALNEAVARCGEDATPVVYRALVLMDQGRTEEAQAQLQRVLAVQPDNSAARSALGILQRRTVTEVPVQ